jgi:hypothetical protein
MFIKTVFDPDMGVSPNEMVPLAKISVSPLNIFISGFSLSPFPYTLNENSGAFLLVLGISTSVLTSLAVYFGLNRIVKVVFSPFLIVVLSGCREILNMASLLFSLIIAGLPVRRRPESPVFSSVMVISLYSSGFSLT